MAGRKQKTRLSRAGGSPDQSSIAKRTDPLCDEEVIALFHDLMCEEEEEEEEGEEEGEEEEYETEEDESEADAEASGDDEWGFGQKKPRFSKEIIVGFAAIAILCSVFAVVVITNLKDDVQTADGTGETAAGESGSENAVSDPFAADQTVQVASHAEIGNDQPTGGGVSNDPDQTASAGGEINPFDTPGSEISVPAQGNELPDSLAEFQSEPTVEDGSSGTAQILDPFGRPIRSSENQTDLIDTGNALPESTESIAGTPESTQPSGLFDTPVAATEANVITTSEPGAVTTEIDPFTQVERPTGRVDEYGRPVDSFGRPVETATAAGELELQTNGDPAGVSGTFAGEGDSSPAIGTDITFGESPAGLPESGSALSEFSGSETSTGLFDKPVPGDAESGTIQPGLELSPGGSAEGAGTAFEAVPATVGESGFLPPATEALPGAANSGSATAASERYPPGTETISENALGPVRSQTSQDAGANANGYQIQSGDSYWTISKKVYGTARYFRVLAEFNTQSIPDPSKMRPGIVIQTPDERLLKQMLLANSAASADSAVAARPVGSPPVTPVQGVFFNEKSEPMYRVGSTDTLTTIAADHLGRWARWRQVYEMNRDQLNNPNKLQIGMVLKLPADASRTAMSRDGVGIR